MFEEVKDRETGGVDKKDRRRNEEIVLVGCTIHPCISTDLGDQVQTNTFLRAVLAIS